MISDAFIENLVQKDIIDLSYRDREYLSDQNYGGNLKDRIRPSGESNQEVWERLLHPKSETFKNREKARSMKDQHQFEQQCSFRPQINDLSQQLSKRGEAVTKTIDDKLYQEAFDKISVRDKLRVMREQEELRNCNFHPNIENLTSIPSVKERVPIEDRYKELVKMKDEMIHSLRKKFLSDKELTFKPKISEISEKVAELRGGGKPVLQRLEEEGSHLDQKKRQLAYDRYKEEAQTCTFHPEVNADQNIQILKNSENRAEYETDFLTRQQIFSENKQKKTKELDIQQQHEQCP